MDRQKLKELLLSIRKEGWLWREDRGMEVVELDVEEVLDIVGLDEAVKAERERIANTILVGVEIHEVTKDHLVKYANRLKRGE